MALWWFRSLKRTARGRKICAVRGHAPSYFTVGWMSLDGVTVQRDASEYCPRCYAKLNFVDVRYAPQSARKEIADAEEA